MKTKKLTVADKIFLLVAEKGCRKFDPKITFEQLYAGGKMKVWSWGADDFKGIEDRGLSFKVQGRLHTGYVVITLDFMDTYTVHLLDTKGVQVGSSFKDIYCDQLTNFIDVLVETPVK